MLWNTEWISAYPFTVHKELTYWLPHFLIWPSCYARQDGRTDLDRHWRSERAGKFFQITQLRSGEVTEGGNSETHACWLCILRWADLKWSLGVNPNDKGPLSGSCSYYFWLSEYHQIHFLVFLMSSLRTCPCTVLPLWSCLLQGKLCLPEKGISMAGKKRLQWEQLSKHLPTGSCLHWYFNDPSCVKIALKHLKAFCSLKIGLKTFLPFVCTPNLFNKASFFLESKVFNRKWIWNLRDYKV